MLNRHVGAILGDAMSDRAMTSRVTLALYLDIRTAKE